MDPVRPQLARLRRVMDPTAATSDGVPTGGGGGGGGGEGDGLGGLGGYGAFEKESEGLP